MRVIEMTFEFGNKHVDCRVADYTERDDDVIIAMDSVGTRSEYLTIDLDITDIELRKLDGIIESEAEFFRMFKAIRGAI